jgi:hypothetical protein
MKPIQVAVLLMRYYCVWAFVDAAITLVEFPADIYGVLNAQTDYLVTQREIALAMMLGRFFIYAGSGAAVLIWQHPLARFLTRGFDDDKTV